MTDTRRSVADVAVPQGGGPLALAILCTVLFLTFLDNTIVSVGLGSVQSDLHAGVLALQWIVGAYALTFASAMLAFGMVGDEFGRVLAAVGPVVGGALIGLWSWRAIFWFNLVFGLAALIAAAVVLPENADPEAHRVDIIGALLGAAALGALIFGVMTGESGGFSSPPVLALFCVSAAAGCAFLWWEHRAAHPLLDLRFLRVARFTTANTVAFCSYFATFAIFFFTALYLAEVVGYSGPCCIIHPARSPSFTRMHLSPDPGAPGQKRRGCPAWAR